MSALALSKGASPWGDTWRKPEDPQTGFWQTSSKASPRTFCATLLVHSGKHIAVEPCWYEGNTVRVVARPVFDANILAIDALYANATAGERPSTNILAIEPRPDPLAALRVERLTRIQTSLGTSLQALAEILRISRPQLYKWLDLTQSVRLQAESSARLLEVERLAVEWSQRSRLPLGSAINELTPEGSPLDLLSEENLDAARIQRALVAIAERLREAPKSPAERMRQAGFARRQRPLPPDD